MAFKLPNLNFFSKLDARARVFVLFGGIVGVLILVYFGTVWLSGSGTAVGPSRVAAAPQGLQSIPGGQLTPEYSQALTQANKQAAQQAQMSGGTAAPTLINTGGQMTTQGNCTVLCSEQVPSIKDLMDGWVKQGTLSPDVESQLTALADKNTSVGSFATTLNALLKAGQLTPEQGRQLLDMYGKEFDYKLLQESAKFMDPLIKAGNLPIDVATTLLDLQKKKVNTIQYGGALTRFVKDSRISPEISQQLLAQYSQQRAKVIVGESLAVLHQMALNGEITPDVEKTITDLEVKLVPLDAFSTGVQNLIQQNKITPAVADKITEEYKMQKTQIGSTDAIDAIVKRAIDAAYLELNQLLQSNAISKDVYNLIVAMIQRNVTFDEFQNTINGLVQQKNLSPEIAKLKIADYLRIVQAKVLADRLKMLQANNATAADYAEELRRGVEQGIISPDEAAALMRDYQALTASTGEVGAGGTASFAKLQQNVQQNASGNQEVATPTQFNVPVAPATPPPTVSTQQADAERQAQLANLRNAMSNQATQLVNAWQPPAMLHKEAPPQASTTTTTTTSGSGSGATGSGASGSTGVGGPVMIKAGTILFAVLETTANSDYPDAPVMATVVDGQYKGAKLMGKLQTSKNAAGQLDRIVLNFTMMNTLDWPSTKSVTAYAIDPDTAKTALATSVNNHYLTRYGALFASSFIQGYATAITTSGSAQVNGSLGTTTTTHPPLDTSDKLYVGLGQAGQTFAGFMQNWVNIPPTVKVDAGVGIGILFMSDVS